MVPTLPTTGNGLPDRRGRIDDNIYEEDDFEMTSSLSTPPRYAISPSPDNAVSVTANAHDSGGKGNQNVKVKMLPPQLHLKG